jgi:uncharacterized protein YxeA
MLNPKCCGLINAKAFLAMHSIDLDIILPFLHVTLSWKKRTKTTRKQQQQSQQQQQEQTKSNQQTNQQLNI